MALYVRVINPLHHYDPDDRQFTDLAFKPQRDEAGQFAVSCFLEECAIKSSGGICQHIAQYYQKLTSQPGVYWRFDESNLPTGTRIVQKTEDNDACHYNIYGPSKNQLRNVRKSVIAHLG